MFTPAGDHLELAHELGQAVLKRQRGEGAAADHAPEVLSELYRHALRRELLDALGHPEELPLSRLAPKGERPQV